MPQSNRVGAPQLLSLCSSTQELQLRSLQQRVAPRSPQLEKAHVRQQRHTTVKK